MRNSGSWIVTRKGPSTVHTHLTLTILPPSRIRLLISRTVKRNRTASVEKPLPTEPLTVTVHLYNAIKLVLCIWFNELCVCRHGVGSGQAEVVLGGVDRAHYSGNFTFTPTLHSDDGFWTIQLDR